MLEANTFIGIPALYQRRPNAAAILKGSPNYPQIYGRVRFYQTQNGVMVLAEVLGLPLQNEACNSPVFGFHIHEGSNCSGNATDNFADTGEHFNPNNCPHPYHSGDFPPLFGANGRAFSLFLTNRFSVEEIIGKTLIIHLHPDDFMSQPSGNSGEKIACGEIYSLNQE